MSEAARSRAREASFRKDIVLAPPDVEAFADEAREADLRCARRVALARLGWENRGFLVRAMLAGLLFSALVAFLIPARYQSTARLMPPDQGASGMGLAMLAAGSNLGSQLGSSFGSMAGDLLGLKNSSDLFIGILESRTVQDDVISAFNLRKVYSDRHMEDARKDLAKRTELSVDRKSGILTIQVTDTRAERAAAMAGEYAAELDRVVTSLNTSSAHRERLFLEDRLSQVKQDLESSEKTFSEFAARNTALDIPTQARATIEAAAALEGQLIAAETELQGLKQIYANGNVRVRATEARVAELREELEKSLTGAAAPPPGLGNPGVASAAGEQSLFPSLRELPALGVSYADLYRNTRIQEAVFQTLTQEFELAKVQEVKETPSVKILDPPDVPEKRSFPPRLLLILLGGLLSIAGALGWLFGRRAWTEIVPGDPQKALAEEVLHTLRARLPWAGSNGSGRISARGATLNGYPETDADKGAGR
jgi:uncharacterized protein involved in exopolysaccharide biosynthesis